MLLKIQDPKNPELVLGLLEIPEAELKALLQEPLKAIIQDYSAEAQLSETNAEIARLQEEVAHLSSPEHIEEVLNEAASHITLENWLKWGQALGYVATPEEQAALEEANKVGAEPNAGEETVPGESGKKAPVPAFKLGDRLFDKTGKEVKDA